MGCWGAGRTELLESLAGSRDAGLAREVTLNGVRLGIPGVANAVKAGVALGP